MLTVFVGLAACILVPQADAATQRPFKEEFGSDAQPTIGYAIALAVDRSTEDVLIADQRTQTISRFHANGTEAPFAKLGSNVIGGLKFGLHSQMAVDESGGPADGDLYVITQDEEAHTEAVDIFSADGALLGQLTGVGPRSFAGGINGIAVDSTGTVFVANGRQITKFAPTKNPPTNADAFDSLPVQSEFLAAGSGPAAKFLFVVIQNQGKSFAEQVDKETGSVDFRIDAPNPRDLAVDPVTHNVLFSDGTEWEANGESAPVQVGHVLPRLGVSSVTSLAVNGAGEVILGEDVTDPGKISLYGSPAVVPTVTTGSATEVTGTRATLNGTVNPAGTEVIKCAFEYGEFSFEEHSVPCEGLVPTGSEPHPVQAKIKGLEPNGHTYQFRLVAYNQNGQEEASGSFSTAYTAVTEPATDLGLTRATLHGLVRPEGSPLAECYFQYGLTNSRTYEGSVPCDPEAGEIGADFEPHEVSALVGGLQGGSTYRFRVVASSANSAFGASAGEELTFTTPGLPAIGEIRASGADQGSVNLEAKVNPSGFATSYSFEWGPTPSYGNQTVSIPIGQGTSAVAVKATLSGLLSGGTYHYRVVATNSRGTTRSADRTAETLNSCGLPEGRCFELVSRSEAGPVALPGETASSIELHFQAAAAGSGALAYPVEGGYPEATRGADVLYRASRGPQGWQSKQLSPPIIAPNERRDSNSIASAISFLPKDLDCGVVESTQPLTDDPGMRFIREEGFSNLYRINPEGSSQPYTGVTLFPPENAGGRREDSLGNYDVAGASQDCSVIVFSTRYLYSGVPAVRTTSLSNPSALYEWRGGTLRQVGIVPGTEGDVAVAAIAGSETGTRDTVNSVSEDGDRIFFAAARAASPNSGEVGAKGLFVRENGAVTRDVSLSQTATPDTGAIYQWATANGSKVFFTANAGLTDESNSVGTDLYEYDLETDELSDRSITDLEGGAEVTGFLGGSADGSQVYFASRNQLVPGQGRSTVQNMQDETFSIYGERGGHISFVGSFREGDRPRVLIETGSAWTSQVSPDGRYLLFESSAGVTESATGNSKQVYLYDRDAVETHLTCVSCAPPGQSPIEASFYEPLTRGNFISNSLHPPSFLVERDGGAHIFFSSLDQLAPGAVAGQNNIYEWAHDQLFRLASAPRDSQGQPQAGAFAVFAGASDDGADVYLITPETLTWQDQDKRASAYDARIGGGFLQPAGAPGPCNASEEGSCVTAPPTAGQPQAPESAAPTSESKNKKNHKRKHRKRKKSKRKRHGSKSKKARHGNGGGRKSK